VYENPEISPAERNQAWRRIEKKYLPHRDYAGNAYLEGGGFWQKQSHIFMAPFYYIDYTLAQVCAFQFWLRDQEDHADAWSDYVRLCEAGGSAPFLELVELANLKSPFQEGGVEEVAKAVTAWLDQSQW
jgi:oligoendopeptidase F